MIDFSKLVPLYNEPHRFYHNLKHIHSMLRMIPELKKEYPKINTNQLTAMIWYHDAYYDPLAPKQYNEMLSAQLYVSHAPIGTFFKPIYDAIMLSAEHTKYDSNLNLETSVFLDLDLMSMGCKYVEYTENIRNIYKEYQYYNVRKMSFMEGRQKFLEAMFNKIEQSPNKSLFYNDFFTERFNKQAVENIEFELERLILGNIL